ncbi:2193_t:CDS:1 [Acaulospora colombiana]|uniref:2193_t:CDS:1 n=1 Tax=Acaulospora colombiana TaxID=27376 RepID=A0ACA9LN41_9GLOM|nr:2193_t:CDS:1 [Acaulospora colombiana]
MNAAARKKHCNLLMFDVPKPSSGAPQNQSFMIDYTTSLENSTIRAQDNFIFTSFVEPMRVRPQTPTRNAAPESEVLTKEDAGINSTKISNDTSKRTPRPPNAFILYRKAMQSEITAKKGNISNTNISRILSRQWRDEKEEVKLYWRKLADKKKVEHMEAHPGYIYRPKKSGTNSKKRCRKTTTTTNSTLPPNTTYTNTHLNQPSAPLSMGNNPTLTINSQPSFENFEFNDLLWDFSQVPQYYALPDFYNYSNEYLTNDFDPYFYSQQLEEFPMCQFYNNN